MHTLGIKLGTWDTIASHVWDLQDLLLTYKDTDTKLYFSTEAVRSILDGIYQLTRKQLYYYVHKILLHRIVSINLNLPDC